MKRRVSKISKTSQIERDGEIQLNYININDNSNGSGAHSKKNDMINTGTVIDKVVLSRDNYNSHPDIPWAVALLTYLSYAIIISVSDYSVVLTNTFYA